VICVSLFSFKDKEGKKRMGDFFGGIYFVLRLGHLGAGNNKQQKKNNRKEKKRRKKEYLSSHDSLDEL
jgi:hypothetical protein